MHVPWREPDCPARIMSPEPGVCTPVHEQYLRHGYAAPGDPLSRVYGSGRDRWSTPIRPALVAACVDARANRHRWNARVNVAAATRAVAAIACRVGYPPRNGGGTNARAWQGASV
jgi:hypothetical protein